MFSKQEASTLRHQFWTTFGKSFPRKWLLYNTKIKGLSLKFEANKKVAMVCMDIAHPDQIATKLLYQQLDSLKTIFESEIPSIIYDEDYQLENGKTISRIYTSLNHKFNIHNKDTWKTCFEFFVDTMPIFERLFLEYEDYIRDAI